MSIKKISTLHTASIVRQDLIRDQLNLLAIVERIAATKRSTLAYWQAVEEYRLAEDRVTSFDECMKVLEVGGRK